MLYLMEKRKKEKDNRNKIKERKEEGEKEKEKERISEGKKERKKDSKGITFVGICGKLHQSIMFYETPIC